MLAAATPTVAQEVAQPGVPVLMTAESITHDQDRQVVTAIGNVEISQENRVLLADKVVYDLKQDRVFASGDVSILEPTGEVVFANTMEVTGDLKAGVAENVRLLLTDKARLAAAVGHRSGGQVNELERAVYSPCLPCRDDPDADLLWQLRAQHVTHDQVTKDIEYEDVWVEMFGVPVFYTPYLSHPDPTVDRRSGFLVPSLRSSEELGPEVTIPYYYVFSPSHDLTVQPRFTTNEGPVLAGEHRKRFTFGRMVTEGSLTRDSNDEVRGHIKADGEFHLSEQWRAGYNVHRSSDQTYLRRYDYDVVSKPFLTSRVYGEGFGRRSYALAESYAFQDQLATQDSDRIPYVAPLLNYSYVGEPDSYGGHWALDASALSLTRSGGTDSQRIAVKPAWILPFTSAAGQVVTLSLGVQAFGYRFSDFQGAGDSEDSSGRVLPEAAVEWRYPFISVGESISQVIEPIVLGVVSPYWDPGSVPNEDSLDLEFSDTNLFRLNRFSGLDRQEVGPRISYGGQYSAYGKGAGYFSVLLGQTYQFRENDDAPDRTGLEDNLSDIVGRMVVSPSRNFDLYYRFRLDKDNLEPHRHELMSMLGPPLLRLVADYTLIDETASLGENDTREQITAAIESAVTENWKVRVFGAQSLTGNEDGLLYNGASLIYEDECFAVTTTYVNSRTTDRDVEAGQTIMLQVNFKTLGNLPISIF